MSASMNHPRRPAMLDPEVAESIPGDEDPAVTTAVALTSARALLGLGDDEFTADQVEKLAHLIKTEGVDAVSTLWARSSKLTLPGQMWRLYLVREWFRRDTDTVRSRYEEGERAIHQRPGAEDLVLPELESTMAKIEQLMTGGGVDSMVELLKATSGVMRVLAAGVSAGPEWITSDDDELADVVTRRAGALQKTAEELAEAAKLGDRE
ncbi:hypothetical protein [Boudabousia marimammalium]|uniref:Uncharacterized protein n=1 Tax=Boudabousia marimammalium TaxID=156892 RepID=A0A1Q5PMB8_9ACTO|nr:hypothetical protein [Boudabousia marimammalium]OKL48625.1 hypothetical protein BM477_05315 [Boudabousia marimammalium]